MKFRIAISILSIVVIGLFLTVFVQTNKVSKLNEYLEESKDSLNTVVAMLQESEANEKAKNDTLISVMKELDVYYSKDRQARLEEVNRKKRAKYKVGITVQANNRNTGKVETFISKTGFERYFVKKVTDPEEVKKAPVIYYYPNTPEAKAMAIGLKEDLINYFGEKLYVKDFNVQPGASIDKYSDTLLAELIIL